MRINNFSRGIGSPLFSDLTIPVTVLCSTLCSSFKYLADNQYRDLLEWMQLFAALKDNTSVTSVDLSDNVITDEGMQFMTGILAVGLAPNLIHVNVRGNPISNRGRELLAGLYHLRKQLKVLYTFQCNLSPWRNIWINLQPSPSLITCNILVMIRLSKHFLWATGGLRYE